MSRVADAVDQARAELAANPQQVEDILQHGAQRARPIAQETLARVREAVGF